ncbi:hypothetical protein EUGRSUZ_J02085 [Eucalyptus grandis]|uniref:Uncharacterized protein n=2 Tax=Eucalyptus grandis TaxID=71139 RepID=A0ACC3J738_EUCGR|nr:hypothetical protein EUGRSUZ_J02085 [Eucalyptus grandis]
MDRSPGCGSSNSDWESGSLPGRSFFYHGNVKMTRLITLFFAGIILPESEKVIAIKEGDGIALPFDVVTWWYNKDDTALLVVLLLGYTLKAHKAGQFTDFFLTGSNGIFTGFTTEFMLVGSQPGSGIMKVDAGFKMPELKKGHQNGMVLNCEEASLEVDIKNGGRVVVGLGANLIRLDGSTMCSPGFSCDSVLQVTYIVSGGGCAQVVGINGKRVLESTVKAGNLFIVPRFFVVSKIADLDGMSWFSIITTPKTSVWKALSLEVLQASFNVPPDMEKAFSSKRMDSEIFFPPN